MSKDTVLINRAPVLTLWAAVVAERLGFNPDEALSLGKAVAGLNAQAKGRALGIFEAKPEAVRKARQRKRGQIRIVLLSAMNLQIGHPGLESVGACCGYSGVRHLLRVHQIGAQDLKLVRFVDVHSQFGVRAENRLSGDIHSLRHPLHRPINCQLA